MSILTKLSQLFESKPLVLVRFEDGFKSALENTLHGLSRFTVVRLHAEFETLKLPSLSLVEMIDGEARKIYVGVMKSKMAVGTFDSRVMLLKLQLLNLSSLEDLVSKLDTRTFQTLLKAKLRDQHFATVLSPKLSVAIIKALSKDRLNKKAIETAASHIPKLRRFSEAESEQFDAIKTAMAAFGLSKSHFAEIVEVPKGSDSTLNYIDSHSTEQTPHYTNVLEDNVIAKDASVIPGFQLIEKHVTGRAVFSKDGERLVVYTANRGPLEKMLGVDLIYINESLGNTVMVQYKMLGLVIHADSKKADWIFRPDRQFRKEIARMKLPKLAKKSDDYRLHPSPFFWKFVQRKGDGEFHGSITISLDHLNHVIGSPKTKGPRGGRVISFETLHGIYLRETDLIGLIRSGYVGTHRIETDALKPLIRAVSEGKRALVVAWQNVLELSEVS